MNLFKFFNEVACLKEETAYVSIQHNVTTTLMKKKPIGSKKLVPADEVSMALKFELTKKKIYNSYERIKNDNRKKIQVIEFQIRSRSRVYARKYTILTLSFIRRSFTS